jgi:hypothetical protein
MFPPMGVVLERFAKGQGQNLHGSGPFVTVVDIIRC